MNQNRLTSELRSEYNFVVCGSGSSWSVVARRLAKIPDVRVLLLEAGGENDLPNVQTASLWPTNSGSERDWGFQVLPVVWSCFFAAVGAWAVLTDLTGYHWVVASLLQLVAIRLGLSWWCARKQVAAEVDRYDSRQNWG